MSENELREQIANEIEARWKELEQEGIGYFFDLNSKFCFQEAAAVARQGL